MNVVPPFEPKVIINPFYTVTLADYLFSSPEPRISREDWVLLNANIIEDMGPGEWLEEFLLAISLRENEYNGHDIINPTLTVSLSPGLQGSHEPLVEQSEWIASNVKMIDDIGVTVWLELLLDVLGK